MVFVFVNTVMSQFVKFLDLLYLLGLVLIIYSVVTSDFLLYFACVCLLYACLKVLRKQTTGQIPVQGQGVYITGCDTGFGRDLARRLDDLGFTVFAGCLHHGGKDARKLKSASSSRLHIVPLDVGSDDSVAKAHEYVVNNLPKNGLWGIVNNAGFNVMGDVELLTINLYNKVMNVNFYGAIRTIKTFLYLVRQSKGRVVIVSSVKGLYSWPANSAYHVTKHGLETMADALRMEMFKFGVKVSVVEPGNFSLATACQNKEHFVRYEADIDEMWENASENVNETYGRAYLEAQLDRQRHSIAGSATDTKPVIDALVDGLISERPQTRYLIDGGDTFIDIPSTLGRYYCYLPTWLSDYIIIKLTGCDRMEPSEVAGKKVQ